MIYVLVKNVYEFLATDQQAGALYSQQIRESSYHQLNDQTCKLFK